MTLSDRVTRLLDAAGVPHAIIGATALAAAGVARSTLDVDVLTTDVRVLDDALWQPLKGQTVEVDVRQGDSDDPLAGVVRLSAANERPVDVIVGRHAWQRRAVDRARVVPNGFRIVQPSDLVLLKLYAGGAQDLWDIRQLLSSLDRRTLTADVDRDVGDLPRDAGALWNRIKADVDAAS